MRIYEGQVYSFNSAVDTSDFYCEFLDIKSPRAAHIHYGYERFWSIGSNSRMILHFQNKNGKWGDRIVKIPFKRIGGSLEFDYPDYLKASGIAYQLKNSQEGILNACGSNYHLVYSKNANISIGCVEFMDYSDYSFMVQYKKPVLYINGKRVTFIETSYDFDDKLMDYVKAHIEQKHELTYAQLAAIADRFEISIIQVEFSDGTTHKDIK